MGSPLARFAHLGQEPDPERSFEEQRRAWIDHGIFCASAAEVERRAGWLASKQLVTVAEQVFGRRVGK